MIFRFCQIVPDKISDKFTEGIFCIRSSIRVALNGNPLGAKKTPLGRMKVKLCNIKIYNPIAYQKDDILISNDLLIFRMLHKSS